jgi:hypothetical protein
MRVYHDVNTFLSTAFVLGGAAQHNGRYGFGDKHGTKLADDYHDYTAACAPVMDARQARTQRTQRTQCT